jgi:signal peptidase I
MALDANQRAKALRAANSRSRRRRWGRGWQLGWLWEWVKVLPPALAVFFVLRTFLVEAFKIPTGSMERTLLVGDFLLVNKWLYGAEIPFTSRRLPGVRGPRIGDIVVFRWPSDPSKDFVKRVVGLPGDTLAMRGGALLRNGLAQREGYAFHTAPHADPMTDAFRWQRPHVVTTAAAAGMPEIYRPSRDNWGPIVVPPKHLFALGDNRDNSLDSRYWGFVPDSLVRGSPWVVYYSFAPDTSAGAAWLTQIRWSRLGTMVR